ncbi:MAG: tetratricopeptide repeat protein, partial [Anaerolineae bacterium]|nr:tetratricopeptide repeat protein [Anaerolineae bacterium]
AIEHLTQALAIAREVGDRRREGDHLGNLGIAYHNLDQIEQAIASYEQALVIARETGNRFGEERLLGSLGLVYHTLGQIERAVECLEQALVIAREIDERSGEGYHLGHLGIAYHALGQIKQAINSYEEALAIFHEIGNCRSEGVWLGNLARAYYVLGQVERTIDLHEEALAVAREFGDRWLESCQLVGLGKALLTTGKLARAAQRCREARDLDVPKIGYQAALALGIALLHQHEPMAGETFTDAAARCRALLEKTTGLYEPRYALAAALVGSAACNPSWPEESGRAALLVPALAEYRRALEICAAPGVVRDALCDLEVIRAAGVEGLEPALDLLEAG